MKSLNAYMTEKFQVSKDNIGTYTYYPETKKELIKCIKEKIKKEGYDAENVPLDLNDIDTSLITDMSNLFNVRRYNIGDAMKNLASSGNFDISDWNVSNVKDMEAMFYCSGFNGDISDWDVSKVEDMSWMFAGSFFNSTIADWNVSNVEDMQYMFADSSFARNIDKWDVSKVKNAKGMFSGRKIIHPKWYYSLV